MRALWRHRKLAVQAAYILVPTSRMSTSRGILPSYLGLCWCNPLCFSFGVDFSYALELCLNYIITLKNMLSSRGTVCLNCSSPASFFISTKMVSTSNYLRRRRWTKGRGWKILSRSKQPAAAAAEQQTSNSTSSGCVKGKRRGKPNEGNKKQRDRTPLENLGRPRLVLV